MKHRTTNDWAEGDGRIRRCMAHDCHEVGARYSRKDEMQLCPRHRNLAAKNKCRTLAIRPKK
jgi:hypothetical protein